MTLLLYRVEHLVSLNPRVRRKFRRYSAPYSRGPCPHCCFKNAAELLCGCVSLCLVLEDEHEQRPLVFVSQSNSAPLAPSDQLSNHRPRARSARLSPLETVSPTASNLHALAFQNP